MLAPDAVAADRVDVLRRALGAETPFHVAPHCTLVPPVNVREEDVEHVVRTLRSAAVAARRFEMAIGPGTTFAPATPTVHLAVAPDAVARLAELRSAVRRGALDRPEQWPDYRPHVTLREELPAERIEAAVASLAGVADAWTVERLHLLEQRRRDDGTPHWVPIREEPFGGPHVVGRGGVEVALRTVRMVEEPVAASCGVAPEGPLGRPGDPAPLVVAAEEPGDPMSFVGAAVGRHGPGPAAELTAVVVAEERRSEGVGRHLLAAWCSAAAGLGAQLVVSEGAVSEGGASRDAVSGGGDGFLAAHGFGPVGDLFVRRL